MGILIAFGLASLLIFSQRGAVVEAQNCTATAPSEPQGLSVTLLSNSSITVQWMEPANDGGDAAINYTITLQGGPGATTRTLSSLSTTFTGLEAPNTYSVTVVAVNCAGSSPPATRTIPFQVPPPPGVVTAMATSGSSITVTWTPPVQDNSPPVTAYTVTTIPSTSPTTAPASTTSTVLSGLQEDTTYTIQVVARSVVGNSPPATASARTFTTPGPPQSVQLTATSPNSIGVSWTMPSDNGGTTIIRYEVTLKRGTAVEETKTSTSENTVFTGLMEGESYTVEVVTVNNVGNSSAASSTIEFSVPSSPVNVTATATSGSSITVTWTPPVVPANGAPVTAYTVTAVPSSGSTVQTTSSTNSTELSGLQEDTEYNIQVVAHNAVGNSSAGTTKAQTFGRPSEPLSVSLSLLSDTSIMVEWARPALDGGDATLTYNITLQGGPGARTKTPSSTSTTFTGLKAPNTYTVQVAAVNSAGTSSPVEGTILFQVPTEPNIRDLTASSTALTVTWTSSDTAIEVDSYNVTVVDGDSQVDSTSVATSLSTASLAVHRRNVTYTVTVTAVNKVGPSTPASRMFYFAVPESPQSVAVTAVSGSALKVSWTAPNQPTNVTHSPTLGYTVSVEGREEDSHNITGALNTMYQITGLAQGTRYTVTVTAHNSVGKSAAATGSGTTFNVPGRPHDIVVTALSGTELKVSWTASSQPSNVPPVTHYTVSWKVEGEEEDSQNTARPVTTMYQITGLAQGTRYTVTVTAHNSVGDSEAATGSGSTLSDVTSIGPVVGAAVGATLAAVCLAALLALVVCLLMWRGKRRRSRLPGRRGPGQMRVWDSTAQFTDTIRMAIHERGANLSGSQQDLIAGQEDSPLSTPVMGRRNTKPSHPVSLDGFVGYVENTSREDLIAEYRSIPTKTHDLMALALMNPLSNRYINILPYDKNRVILSEPNSDGNDYINASYIDGYEKEHAFIAAQGPLQRTVDDFWQMVWDQQTSVMVMLTKCMEGTKSKCAEYFPKNVNGRVFVKMSIAVETKSIHMYKDYEVRVLQVKNNKTGSTRLVHHFYYFGWPDFGVPESPTGVLTMLHHVRAIRRSGDQDAPAIIHCSAGVGRTGTFIALDYLVHQVQAEGENAMIDIEALVSTMRAQRGTMVQASEQYVFIHRALREYLLLGYTMMPGPELRSKVEEMSPVKRHSGISPFQEQYERLEYITAPYTQAPKVDEEFQSKIRFPNKGPYEGKYIGITPVAGDFSSSFINASVVDGYRQTKQFIVAQSPMHSTTGDFWALVYEKQSPTVILLCPFQENGEESSVCFWPSKVGNTENFVGYKVTWKSEDLSPSFTTHRLVVQPDAEDLSPLDVTLFHLENWSAATMPKSGAVLSLLETVRAGQREGPTSPTVVACNDGLGRSCSFVALWVLTDQLMTEDQVDVVSTFKALRANRPGAMDSLDYFIHCYHLLMQYREMHNPTQEE